MKNITLLLLVFVLSFSTTRAQESVAREWNETLLSAIRLDFARPTVHARNLFHTSIAMYDSWAIFDTTAETVFLGKVFGGYNCAFNGTTTPTDVAAARHEMMSYAMYRLLTHRFANSPNPGTTQQLFDDHFSSLGYDSSFTSTDYSTGSYAALGNYLAQELIAFGLQDGANEQGGYANVYYTPSNTPLIMQSGYYDDMNDMQDPNRWQPLSFDTFIDQSGNVYPVDTPSFLSPEWGAVTPFCLKPTDLDILNDGFDCYVYNDPGPPAYIQNSNEDGFDDPYKWNFSLVASWSSHLDPDDPTLIDISPASIGNIDFASLPTTFEEYKVFYDFMEGGDPSPGYTVNPSTGLPYTPQMVKRGDYGRVLAEFWADGPDSETPPGHWFTILNYVSDHPELEKRIGGVGSIVDDLEWDVKSYLALGGSVHDCAVNIWGIKGYYDYVRPVSAIRYMAWKGQSSDMSLPSYDPHGLPLIPGRIELIEAGDPLAGSGDENVGKIKIYAWKGPDYISDPETDIAHVDWILGTRWWPYQRPSFVSPPFAGYLSGHSTFSRAAAETLTLFTGDAYFPGGMGIFDADQNQFLVFEEGPSQNIELQWATYKDASDQCSLSRIWGGIHPPIDDIRGRIIGNKIGVEAYNLATQYFNGTLNTQEQEFETSSIKLYPVPFKEELHVSHNFGSTLQLSLYSLDGKQILDTTVTNNGRTSLSLNNLSTGVYVAKFIDANNHIVDVKKIVKN